MSPSHTFSSPATIFMFLFFILNLPFSNSLLKSPSINATSRRAPRQLSVNYYAKKCPQVESLIGYVTSNMFKEAPASAPATIRLFFHDCFVEVSHNLLVAIIKNAISEFLTLSSILMNKIIPHLPRQI